VVKQYVVVKHARSDEQRLVLEQINTDGVCPFCPENLSHYHRQPILIEGKHWVVTKNQWPYANTSLQLLVITKRHIEHISELTAQEWVDLGEVVARASLEFKIDSGAMCMRFGEPGLSSASVTHLHAQIIVSDPKALESVKFKIGKG